MQRTSILYPRTLCIRCTRGGIGLAKQKYARTRRVLNHRAISKHNCRNIVPPSINSGVVSVNHILQRSHSNSTIMYDQNANEGTKVRDSSNVVNNSDNELFRHIISRFKRLEKDPASDDVEDVISKSEKLVNIFLGLASLPNVKDKMVVNLNTILNFYDVLDSPYQFAKLLSQMKSQCLANETTYFLYIRHEMKTKSWVDGLQIVENMKKNSIEIHARTYYHIILNAVGAGDMRDSLKIMLEMKKLQNMFDDRFYNLVFESALASQRGKQSFIYSVLDLLKDTGYILGPKSFGTLKRWFEKDKRTWKVGTALVNIRGICKCCGMQLKTFSLPEQRRVKLEEKLRSIAENAISSANSTSAISHGLKLPVFTSTSNNDQRMKVQALKHYIESNGPFDIALDVLNAAYFRDRGFNSFQVKRIVRHFKGMGKHVLALCSSPLLSSLLEVDAAPNLPNYHMIQLLHYLRRQQCGIFFVDDKKEDGHIDDHFILLSMVFHHMNIDVITADKFGDHVESLDIFTRRDFERWMRAHQIVLQTFTDNGKPIFRRRENFDTDIQNTETSWHIPGPNRQWLCCTRR